MEGVTSQTMKDGCHCDIMRSTRNYFTGYLLPKVLMYPRGGFENRPQLLVRIYGMKLALFFSRSMLGATFSRVRGGLMSKVNVRSATVPVGITGGRAMSVWSEMPMGPPDPILGLTGEMEIKLEYSKR